MNSALEEAESAICRIVRRKLRVTLRNDDGREDNLDALDVLGDIRLKLVRKLRQPEEAAIDDWSSYVATVAYNCCNDYLRAKYPEHSRLKNALMRLLQKSSGCAVWTSSEGEGPLHTSYDQIAAYVDGAQEATEREWMEYHLKACKQCATEVKDLKQFDARMLAEGQAPVAAAPAGKDPLPKPEPAAQTFDDSSW
jgi:DNA-directed RNA polymerase specialized sigma24 family protein